METAHRKWPQFRGQVHHLSPRQTGAVCSAQEVGLERLLKTAAASESGAALFPALLQDQTPNQLSSAIARLFIGGDLSTATPRALWNLLWVAGELQRSVDIFHARALFSAIAELYKRQFATLAHSHEEFGEVATMGLRFVLLESAPQLELCELPLILTTLEQLAALPNRFCRDGVRCALEGLRDRAPLESRDPINRLLQNLKVSPSRP